MKEKAAGRTAAQIKQSKGVNSVKRFEGGSYVVDYSRRTVNSVGARTGQQLHHGRIYSHPAGAGYHCRTV
jgi:hypothetical protein